MHYSQPESYLLSSFMGSVSKTSLLEDLPGSSWHGPYGNPVIDALLQWFKRYNRPLSRYGALPHTIILI